MTGCTNCGKPLDSAVCPYCRLADGLARAPAADDRLDRSVTESLLARADAGVEDFLARDLGGPLALGELRDAIARVESGDPSVAELEGALAQDASVALDGIALTELVDRASSDMKTVRRGLVFLKNRRYAEAIEWWTLHREGLDAGRERLQLLLLLLEAFTHRLAGDHRRAAEVRIKITAHPVYRRMRGLART